MKIALLNSRKPRHPDSVPEWLSRTFSLASQIARGGHILRTSLGNEPYEAACYGAARAGGFLEVITDPKTAAERLDDLLPPDYPRLSRLHLEHVSDTPGPGLERDRCVIEGADLAIAVAVRGRGHMETLLEQRWRDGRVVQVVEPWDSRDAGQKGNVRLLEAGVPPLAPEWNDPQMVRHDTNDGGAPAFGDKTGKPDAGALRPPALTSNPAGLPLWFDSPFLCPTLAHFTRACPGPWPGQPAWAYYEDLFVGGLRALRDSRAALRRIVEERAIRAGSRLIRGGYGLVSFTAVKPEALATLHRYQRHLLRWDFEPFGLVFKQSWLEARGARPVRYLSPSAFAGLPGEERPWFQKHDPPGCDYSAEQEWRFLGDLDFSDVPEDVIRIVLPPALAP